MSVDFNSAFVVRAFVVPPPDGPRDLPQIYVDGIGWRWEVNAMYGYMDYGYWDYYPPGIMQQPGFPQYPGYPGAPPAYPGYPPAFPSPFPGDLQQRVTRLERAVNRLESEVDRLQRRAARLEGRLGVGELGPGAGGTTEAPKPEG